MKTKFDDPRAPDPAKAVRTAFGRNRRVWIRSEVETSLRYPVPGSREFAVARLYNYCPGGFYFENPAPMEPDAETTIVIPDLLAEPPASDGYGVYRVKIRWCRELENQPETKYGIGSQLLGKQKALIRLASPETAYLECDRCGRSLADGCVCRIQSGVCLCVPCYKDLANIPAGPVREAILRFISGNIL